MPMVVIEFREFLWRTRLAFFPVKDEVDRLLVERSFNEVLHIIQAGCPIESGRPGMVHYEAFPTSCIDLSKPIEELYRAMDPKSCRYEIRKAEKCRDQIEIGMNDERSRADFFRIYNRFAAVKRHARPLTHSQLEALREHCDIFVAYLGGEPVCVHSLLRDEGLRRVRLHLSGSARLDNPEVARSSGFLNRYLHWHEIQLYKSRGMRIYDFGGLGRSDEVRSITRFKQSFGGAEVQEHSYTFAGPAGRLRLKAGAFLRSSLPRTSLGAGRHQDRKESRAARPEISEGPREEG